MSSFIHLKDKIGQGITFRQFMDTTMDGSLVEGRPSRLYSSGHGPVQA
ncbi:hypothetical protein NST44_19440 [Paenibacillus sp. FSL W8-0919]